MATTKKAVTKRVTKKAKEDVVLWAVLYRTFMTWKVHSLYRTEARANEVRRSFETQDSTAFSRYKVERARLYD